MKKYMMFLSNKQKLELKYGSKILNSIEKKIKQYQTTISMNNIDCEFIYHDTQIKNINKETSVQCQFEELKKYIKDWNRKRRLDYLFILGGDDIVPFYKIPDSAIGGKQDGEYICSDDPYVSFSSVTYRPTIPVGRLPDPQIETENDKRFLINQLDKIIRFQKYPPMMTAIPVGYSCREWEEQSQIIYNCLPNSNINPLIICSNQIPERDHITQANIYYFNLHGNKTSNFYFCDAEGPFFSIDLIPNICSAFILSECCYGACVLENNLQHNIALNFLSKNAFIFVGATAKSYGGWGKAEPLLCADLLAKLIIEYLKDNHISSENVNQVSIGETLIMAKRDYTFHADEFLDKKTLLEFILLGDPSVVPIWKCS